MLNTGIRQRVLFCFVVVLIFFESVRAVLQASADCHVDCSAGYFSISFCAVEDYRLPFLDVFCI